MSPDERIARLAERQHSVFTRAQALHVGFSPDQIDRKLSSGLWLRLHRSAYRVLGARPTFEGAALDAVFAGGSGARASHTTSARLFALEGCDGAELHIAVARGRRIRVPGVVVHQLRCSDVTRVGVIPVTTPVRTMIDIAGVIDAASLEDALDDAWRRRLLTPERCLKALDRSGRVRGGQLLRKLLLERLGSEPSGSGRENQTRRLIVSAGLPAPERQHRVFDAHGNFIARPDLAYPEAKVYIEFDSTKWHGTKESLTRDHVRQNRLVAAGWLPIVVDDAQLRNRPSELIDELRRALAARGAGDTLLNKAKGPRTNRGPSRRT